jgi:hypothetical protein
MVKRSAVRAVGTNAATTEPSEEGPFGCWTSLRCLFDDRRGGAYGLCAGAVVLGDKHGLEVHRDVG